jgi:hypothetical protein
MNFYSAQRPRFIFVICLALSVTGVFSLAAMPDLTAFDFWKNKFIDASVIKANAGYTIDCFAELRSKTKGEPTLPSRKSAYGILFLRTLCACAMISLLVIKAVKPAKAPHRQSTLLLKLRI